MRLPRHLVRRLQRQAMAAPMVRASAPVRPVALVIQRWAVLVALTLNK